MDLAKLALLYFFVRQACQTGNYSRDDWVARFRLVHPGDYFYIAEAARLDGIVNFSAHFASPVLDVLFAGSLSEITKDPREMFVYMVNGTLTPDRAGFISRAFSDFVEARQNAQDRECDGAHIGALESWLESEFAPKEFGFYYSCAKDAYQAKLNAKIFKNASQLSPVDRFGLLLHYFSLLGSDFAQAFCLHEAVAQASDRLIAHCLALLVSNSTRDAFSALYNQTIDAFVDQQIKRETANFLWML